MLCTRKQPYFYFKMFTSVLLDYQTVLAGIELKGVNCLYFIRINDEFDFLNFDNFK